MSNRFESGKGFEKAKHLATGQEANRPTDEEANQPQLPALTKVMQSHAIAQTQADVAAVEKLAQLRQETVLKAFDHYMAQADERIIRGVGERMSRRSLDFFAAMPLEGEVLDLEAQFQQLLPSTLALPALAEVV